MMSSAAGNSVAVEVPAHTVLKQQSSPRQYTCLCVLFVQVSPA